jgi:nucleoside-diphosphate-sugar epimerase
LAFIAVIGGTGHIGSFLVPRLLDAGHRVVCVSRHQRAPYTDHSAWSLVEHAIIDRSAEESHGRFGQTIASLGADVVIDLTCYTLDSAVQLVNALTGAGTWLVHCGTIWVHGPGVEVPTTEDEPRRPFGEYGCRKAAIERYLMEETRAGRVAATVLHPGHLVGPGWAPINPAGNFNVQVFDDLAAGRDVRLPNLGTETLHHVHVDDVAQAFALALSRPDASIGESFHVVSPRAMTLRGYAERMAEWFGMPASLTFLAYDDWRRGETDRDAAITLDHLRHSSNCSMEKASLRLGYTPRYSSLAAVQESVAWLLERGRLERKETVS